MISIIRARTGPAFHIACIPLRGLVMYPPDPRTTSRSPERNPISPLVTIGSSRPPAILVPPIAGQLGFTIENSEDVLMQLQPVECWYQRNQVKHTSLIFMN